MAEHTYTPEPVIGADDREYMLCMCGQCKEQAAAWAEEDPTIQACDHAWETGTVYGDGYQGLVHYERRCSQCGAFQEISNGKIIAGWW